MGLKNVEIRICVSCSTQRPHMVGHLPTLAFYGKHNVHVVSRNSNEEMVRAVEIVAMGGCFLQRWGDVMI